MTTVKYMMFVMTDPEPDTVPDESDVERWVDDLDASGKRIIGEVLEPPTSARVIRIRDGERSVAEGGGADSTAWICGFDILECESIDEAVEIASRHPMARNGRLEIRPFTTWE
ncbi:hypothetical protein O159_06640 [Leifsonia xyli subsp. cynodontis DSM 46306]|uniref:YCII-related domain-containing protein n=1 Tax=Leifsonia xyli subsp. cynodontis DSM 46306 TaxID=1389489 RepID=U3PBH3_LEIXC|nr:hypothetical protein O159_06640 [Leifsonia xyli subsp. cynodontis DSM 46306]